MEIHIIIIITITIIITIAIIVIIIIIIIYVCVCVCVSSVIDCRKSTIGDYQKMTLMSSHNTWVCHVPKAWPEGSWGARDPPPPL